MYGHYAREISRLIQNMRCGQELQSPKDEQRRAFLSQTFQRLLCLFPNFACISTLLHRNLTKGTPRRLDHILGDGTSLFEVLIARFVAPLILSLPRTIGKFTVDTDSWDQQVDCVLLQNQPDVKAQLVKYWSQTLSSPEQN